MQTYTYFWKNQNNNVVSPYFDSEEEAIAWTKEIINRKLLEDAKAEDEAFEIIERKQI
jgi:hypothetical protein